MVKEIPTEKEELLNCLSALDSALELDKDTYDYLRTSIDEIYLDLEE